MNTTTKITTALRFIWEAILLPTMKLLITLFFGAMKMIIKFMSDVMGSVR